MYLFIHGEILCIYLFIFGEWAGEDRAFGILCRYPFCEIIVGGVGGWGGGGGSIRVFVVALFLVVCENEM